MRIRRLELVGFKSFVSRTRFEFPDGITAVVGPNGCGKSNIVDAIRWVLGEQSPSHLRGKAMEDVIFNGNERTGPLGMAEVSLALERTGTGPLWDAELEEVGKESELHQQLAGVSEITVTRRYFRSGESEFFINKVPCRLRDIHELFLGSGIGTKAYATIEQGRVEQLVNAKPETLRLFIEEAAGTTRYRSRKIIAERKLDRTRDNLGRLADVIQEIERQTNTLTRQAKRAEEYRRCRDELRVLEMGIARERFRVLAAEVSASEAHLGPLREQEARLVADLRRCEGGAVEARAAVRAAEERERALQVRIVERRLEAEAASQRLGYVAENLAAIARRRADGEADQRRLEQALADASGACTVVEAERRDLEAGVRDAGQRHARIQAELREQEQALAGAERAVEEVKEAAVAALAEDVRLTNLSEALGRRGADVDGRLERARERRRGIDGAMAACADQARANQVASLRLLEAIGAAEAEVRGCGGAMERASELEGRAAREADGAREKVATVRSRLSSLEELAGRREGYARGLEHVVRASPERVLGVVADVLRVPREFEAAVAGALGPRLQCLITRDHAEAAQALSALRGNGGGRASFVPLAPRRVSGHGGNGAATLLEVVEVTSEFRALAESLLGDVLVVETLEDAMALWGSTDCFSTIVTKAGHVIDGMGMLSGGSEGPLEEMLLARNREIRELRAAVAEAQSVASSAAERHGAARVALDASRSAREESARRMETLRAEHARVLEDAGRLQEELRRLQLDADGADAELAELEQERRDVEEESREAHRGLEVVRSAKGKHDAALVAATEAVQSARGRAEAARARLTEVAIEEARQRASQDRAEDASRRASEQVAELRRSLAALCEQQERLADDAVRLEREHRAIETARAEKLSDLERAELEASTCTEAVARAVARTGESERALHACRAELEACRERRPAVEVKLAEHRMSLEHLVSLISEKYGVDLRELPRGDQPLEGGASIADQGDAEARVESLRRRLSQIGEVHVGAIDELEELQGRHRFLCQQRDDLQRSIDDLRKTIAKLNRLSRTRFQETFEQANRSLQQVFPRLFPGGRAHLLLTEAEEGGEPGVEIAVQPRGKRLQSLTLLSGGEKALTAVSLILSLFMIRPTPFCVLDEVDAPLDDVNVGRFDLMIREISRVSQFVVITHNKRTMEAADTLYGVTMEEPGVSRVVAVRFKQAA
jgi:chromosome segregation protein